MVSALLLVSPRLAAERDRPSPLLGGTPGVPKAAPDLDPRLPKGAKRLTAARPPLPPRVSCGLRRAVCVHAGAGVSEQVRDVYLTALEGAWDRFVGGARLPAPLPDPGLGPTPGLDLYLLRDAELDVAVLGDARRALEDRTSAFCRVHPAAAEPARQAAACLIEAALLGLNAAETPHARRAIAAELRLTASSPRASDYRSFDDLQANPQLGFWMRDVQPESAAAALWFTYVDQRLATPQQSLGPVALQLARGATPAGELEWHAEPDALDVLRQAFAESSQTFDAFLLDFAIARAFMGARDASGAHPSLAWLGNAGRVRFDWAFPISSLPRRVAPRRPLEPYGAAYLWLDLDRVTLGKTLAFRAEWESPVGFRWALIAVDAEGQKLKRFDLPYVQNATSAERTLVDYDGAIGFVIVGTNLGGIDLAHPFDPDFEPFEPHGFTVYLAEI